MLLVVDGLKGNLQLGWAGLDCSPRGSSSSNSARAWSEWILTDLKGVSKYWVVACIFGFAPSPFFPFSSSVKRDSTSWHSVGWSISLADSSKSTSAVSTALQASSTASLDRVQADADRFGSVDFRKTVRLSAVIR